MTASEFLRMEIPDQISVLYNEGVYLGKRKEEDVTVLLYQLHNFYAEIFYRDYRKYVLRIAVSTSTVILDPYLAAIDLEFLVSES